MAHTVINSSILYLFGAGSIHLTMVILVLKASTAVKAGTPIALLLALTSSLCARMVFTLRDRLHHGRGAASTIVSPPECGTGRTTAMALPLLRPCSKAGRDTDAEICIAEMNHAVDHRGSSLTLLQEITVTKPDCAQPSRDQLLR